MTLQDACIEEFSSAVGGYDCLVKWKSPSVVGYPKDTIPIIQEDMLRHIGDYKKRHPNCDRHKPCKGG